MRGMSALRPTTVIERVWCDESSSAVWREPMGGENREQEGGRLDCRGDLQRVLLRDCGCRCATPRNICGWGYRMGGGRLEKAGWDVGERVWCHWVGFPLRPGAVWTSWMGNKENDYGRSVRPSFVS